MSEQLVIKNGDCRTVLATMDAESVQCCVTSPPYFGLRSYFPDAVRLKANLSPEDSARVVAELDALGIRPHTSV